MEEKVAQSANINFSEIKGMVKEMKVNPQQLCKHHNQKEYEQNTLVQIISAESLKENMNCSNSKMRKDAMQCVLYCNLCEEPVCLKCIQEGPHNTFAHQIIKIEKAAENKLKTLRNSINCTILKERQNLLQEIEVANYLQNSLLVKVFSDIKSEMAKDFWSKIGSTERYVNEQVIIFQK